MLGQWWPDFAGEAGARERAALLPRLFFEHFTDTSYLIEDESRQLVAFLIGFLSPSRPGLADVHFVGVDPAPQRAGLGRWLYARFCATATVLGAQEVGCITSPGNRNSIAFHTRLDFRLEPGDRTVEDSRCTATTTAPDCTASSSLVLSTTTVPQAETPSKIR